MTYKIEFAKQAAKQFKALPRQEQQKTSCKSKFIMNFIGVYLCLSVDNIKTKHFRKNSKD